MKYGDRDLIEKFNSRISKRNLQPKFHSDGYFGHTFNVVKWVDTLKGIAAP